MVRIVGIDLPKVKRIEYALMSIYGIGLTASQTILEYANIDKNKRVHELEDNEIVTLREVIDTHFKTEEDLRRVVKQNILRLSQINCVKEDDTDLDYPFVDNEHEQIREHVVNNFMNIKFIFLIELIVF